MTTNRMGLEQTLSDGELTVITDTDHVQCGDAAAMARELLAHRKASKEAAYFINKVTYGDDVELRIYCYELDAMKSKDDFGGVVIPLYAAPPPQAVTVPDGWVMAPKEPTEDMVIEGFESEPDFFFSDSDEWAKFEAMSGCEQAAHKARLCWAAMIAVVPKISTK